jgi:hypothetical protein
MDGAVLVAEVHIFAVGVTYGCHSRAKDEGILDFGVDKQPEAAYVPVWIACGAGMP